LFFQPILAVAGSIEPATAFSGPHANEYMKQLFTLSVFEAKRMDTYA
jgi:hypothetical protein